MQHVIDTGDARPIKVRPCCLPLARLTAVEKELEHMLQAGIVESSESPWVSAVIMVPLKNNSRWQFCIVSSIKLQRVASLSCFSTLDLMSSYWQVLLSHESAPKTATQMEASGSSRSFLSGTATQEKVLLGVPEKSDKDSV